MGHWTPTGIEPRAYDDDDDFYTRRTLACNVDEFFDNYCAKSAQNVFVT